MRIRRIRFRKEYRVKGRIALFIIFLLCLILIPQPNRALMASFFSSRCRNEQQIFSRRLTDRIVDYSLSARANGVERSANALDISRKVMKGQLVRIKGNRFFKIEDLTHSYPYLTRDGRRLLREIGRRFREKTKKDGLKGSKFIVTSMTRTTEKIRGLGRTNMNASDNSPHLNGNAFDISYARFSIMKFRVTECDKWYMKEALAEVIWKLRQEKKCWATYERQQGCFHVVVR